MRCWLGLDVGILEEGEPKVGGDPEKELRRGKGGERTRVPWERKRRKAGDRQTGVRVGESGERKTEGGSGIYSLSSPHS